MRCRGLIVGVVTLTGLGLKFSSIVLQYADGGSRAIYDALVALGAAGALPCSTTSSCC